MERNVKLLVAYDGTDFHGWQRQPGLRTVQGMIEQATRRVCQHQVNVVGAGRTDAGVHAAGQTANFVTTSDIPALNLMRAIGGRLPKDITLIHATDVPMMFHSTRAAQGKLYRYRIHNATGRPAEKLCQRYVYHFWQPLDLDRMREAARAFIGEQDFAAMASRGDERGNTIRTVTACQVYRHYDEIRIDVEGRGFLYNQVRNMVGTLVEIGRGHWPMDCIGEILASRDRKRAGPTAPARGLSLQWVRYELGDLPDIGEWWTRELPPPETQEDAGSPEVQIDPTLTCESSTSSPD
jgi:tRNA pseudouridine38-40 synthase